MADNKSVSKVAVVFEGDSKLLEAAVAKSMTAMKKFEKQAEKTNGKSGKGGLNGILSTAKKLAPAIGLAFSIEAIGRFTKEVIRLGSQLEGIERAFQNIAFEGKTSLSELQTATMGTVSNFDLMQKAVMASNFKVPLENLASFFKFATIRAQQTGESVDYLVNSIVLGIGRKSPLILDNLGITLVRLKEAMGKVGRESATVADISQAVMKIAEQETRVYEKLGFATETSANKIAKIGAAWKNFKANLGEDITESSILTSLGEMAEGLSLKDVAKDLAEMAGFGGDLAEAGRALDETVLGNTVATPKGFLKTETKTEIKDMVGLVKALEKEIARLNDAASKEVKFVFGDMDSDEMKAAIDSGVWDKWINGASESALETKRLEQAMLSLINNTMRAEEEARAKEKAAREHRIKVQLNDLKDRLSQEEDMRAISAITQAEMAESLAERQAALKVIDDLLDDNTLSIEDANTLMEMQDVLSKSILKTLKAQADEEARKAANNAKYMRQLAAMQESFDREDIDNDILSFQIDRDFAAGDVKELEDINNRITQAMQEQNLTTEQYLELAEIQEQIEGDILKTIEQQGRKRQSEIDQLQNMASAYQQIHQAMTAIMGVVGEETGFGRFVQGFGKVVTVVAAAAGAMAAFQTLVGNVGAAGIAVGIATGVAATISGIANISTGTGGANLNSLSGSASGSQTLYTQISGRDLRIVLDRDGKFSGKRG